MRDEGFEVPAGGGYAVCWVRAVPEFCLVTRSLSELEFKEGAGAEKFEWKSSSQQDETTAAADAATGHRSSFGIVSTSKSKQPRRVRGSNFQNRAHQRLIEQRIFGPCQHPWTLWPCVH